MQISATNATLAQQLAPKPARPGVSAQPERRIGERSDEPADLLAGAEQAAERSRTSRRDALAQDLERLIEIARRMNGVGDPRQNADAMAEIARDIAKVARKLAEAERALPPEKRKGVPAVPATAGTSGAAARTAAPEAGQGETPSETPSDAPAVERSSPTNPDTGRTSGAEDTDPSVGLKTPFGRSPADYREAAGRDDGSDAASVGSDGREGTRALLLKAAGTVEKIVETIEKAEAFERLLNPEAAEDRQEQEDEVRRLANEIRDLGGQLSPSGPTLDLSV